MPITFAERMAMVEEKNRKQRLELANTFLPIFQGIAQKKMLDEQYAIEQKRIDEQRVAAQKRTADALAKVSKTGQFDETMPTEIQVGAFNKQQAEQQKLKDMDNETNAYLVLLPKDKQDEFAKTSTTLTPEARNLVIKKMAKDYSDTIDDERKIKLHERMAKINLRYSPRQLGGDGGDTAAIKSIKYKNLQAQNALRQGKKYQVKVQVMINGKPVTQNKSLMVKALNEPNKGGLVFGTIYDGKEYRFNGASILKKENGKWVRGGDAPEAIKNALFQAQTDWNAVTEYNPITGEMTQIDYSKNDFAFEGLGNIQTQQTQSSMPVNTQTVQTQSAQPQTQQPQKQKMIVSTFKGKKYASDGSAWYEIVNGKPVKNNNIPNEVRKNFIEQRNAQQYTATANNSDKSVEVVSGNKTYIMTQSGTLLVKKGNNISGAITVPKEIKIALNLKKKEMGW